MNRPLRAVFPALFDAALWKAILVAVSVAVPLWFVQESFDYMEVNEWTGVGWFAITLYFVIRSCRFLIRRFQSAARTTRMWIVLVVLAILHVLGLVSFFSFPFASDKPRHFFAEAWDVEFWVFPALFATLWALTSLLILLRHSRLHQPGEAQTLRLFAIGVSAVLLVIAIGTAQLAAPALSQFRAFGADLPTPTLLFIHDHWAFYLLPAGAAVAAVLVFLSPDSSARSARFASGGLVGLLVLGNALLYTGLFSLFLPFFNCGFVQMDAGFTRLHAAALLGRGESALRHMAAGADVNAEDAQGYRPLDQIGDSASEIARLLTAHGGVRSTKESRRRKVEGMKAQASADASFGGCRI